MISKATMRKRKKEIKKRQPSKPRHRTKSRHQTKSLGQIRALVLQYVRRHEREDIHTREVGEAVGAADALAFDLVEEILEQFVRERVLRRGKSRKSYYYEHKSKVMEGKFRRKAGKGHNFFFPDDGSDPIRVAERNSGHALDGDSVRVQLLAARRGQEAEGEVIEITERVESTFVGVMSINHGLSFLITDSNKLNNDILIPERNLNGAKDGEKVVVRVLEWPERAKNPVGEVLAIIGTPGDNDTEMHAILAEYGLPYVYPSSVEEYADGLDEQVALSDEFEREDFRDAPTFTIDPADAKDYDDALSIRRMKSGHWEVGVHIADVTAYVRPGDPIDKEAAERATSVYLVDRTVPMLPERLCNDLCSLREGVDRPAYSVIFEMNDQAKVLDYRITRTVINSNRRMAYEEAQAMITGAEGDYAEEVRNLNALAQKLRQRRMKNGSIDFDRTEMAFELDEKGKPLEVYVKHSLEANKLIEEFMLLANQAVAQFVQHLRGEKTPPAFVYRVHDRPDEDRLHELSEFVQRMGYRLDYTGEHDSIAAAINRLLEEIQGKPEENMIEVLTIRTMAKAVYQTENIGHFGLGFADYTHFTSPIRRHPDMMVHRLLTRYMAGKPSVNKKELDEICKHDSEMENLASDAERTSIKYKQVEYMQERLGMEFDGVISGVKDFGIFVELTENGCEGLVPIRELDDDYYELDEKTYALVGYNHKRRYALGDKIKVRVARADLGRRQLDFGLAESEQ